MEYYNNDFRKSCCKKMAGFNTIESDAQARQLVAEIIIASVKYNMENMCKSSEPIDRFVSFAAQDIKFWLE